MIIYTWDIDLKLFEFLKNILTKQKTNEHNLYNSKTNKYVP